uniref:Uncharacterized protein n=1 Tax=Nelumbo nucifera TaxID=4432 RepID=A0A822ZDJ9_NELNU|nr:TPA_asm: hypothetical protein HUJ06_016084 [Nelumbo nucifera]
MEDIMFTCQLLCKRTALFLNIKKDSLEFGHAILYEKDQKGL